jgi:hypothetical protein
MGAGCCRVLGCWLHSALDWRCYWRCCCCCCCCCWLSGGWVVAGGVLHVARLVCSAVRWNVGTYAAAAPERLHVLLSAMVVEVG